ncbi:MAG: HAD family hydrolase [Bacillota bacterium]|nr:HAD family hydrolase [Bacillota bacterium]
MKKYKVLSFDVFQTLVDVNKRIPHIWQGILKEKYTKDRGIAGANAILQSFPKVYEKVISSSFRNMEDVYMECVSNAVAELNFTAGVEDVAYNLMFQHGMAPIYDDVPEVIRKLYKKYRIVISSDSNHLMVDPILKNFSFENSFISDDLKCYKGDATGKFFKTVLKTLQIHPSEILHIGDSSADVTGAHFAGIDACWINRERRILHNNIKPDYDVTNFSELLNILL